MLLNAHPILLSNNYNNLQRSNPTATFPCLFFPYSVATRSLQLSIIHFIAYLLHEKQSTMKSFVAASLLALIGASAAGPSNLRFAKRTSPNGCPAGDPGQTGVINAINAWNNDVVTVNSFLDSSITVLDDPAQVVAALQTVIPAAQDEPNQLQVLACESDVIAGTAAQAAVDDLAAGFNDNVLVPLTNIMNGADDADTVNSNLQTINQFRCCHVLPDLDTLWSSTAEDEGVADQVPLSAPRPGACSIITC